MKEAVIFGLSKSIDIASNVAKKTKIPLGKATIKTFADKEMFVQVDTSVRNKEVFVIQSTQSPANDTLMELLLFLDALKRSSAKIINVIIPYFGYARQDRKVRGRQSISAKLVADMIQIAGANRIISFDIHSEQIQGFFDIPVDILRASGIISEEIKKLKIPDLVVVSPDHGGVVRARRMAESLDNAPLAIIDKRRTGNNKVEALTILGNVKGKNIIIFDDMIDTGGTIVEAAIILRKAQAKDIFVAATHAVLSDKDNQKAIDKLENAGIKKLITTNSIIQNKDKRIIVIDLSSSIAGMINAHLKNESITDYFIEHFSTKL